MVIVAPKDYKFNTDLVSLPINNIVHPKLFEERNNYCGKLFSVHIHSPGEIKNILINSNFELIRMFEKVEKNWLTIIAKKPFK